MSRDCVIYNGNRYKIRDNREITDKINDAIVYRGKIGWTTRLTYDDRRRAVGLLTDAKDKNGVWSDTNDYVEYVIPNPDDYREVIQNLSYLTPPPVAYAHNENDRVFPPIKSMYGYGGMGVLNPYNDVTTKPGLSQTAEYDVNSVILPKQHGLDFFINPTNQKPSESDKRLTWNYIKNIYY